MTPIDGEVDAVLRILAGRRSVTRFADTPVERRDIELALNVGICAPNHRLTRPWRFVVVRGEARHRLGERMAAAAARPGQDVERARGKALIAPTIICAAVSP
jgi:nitroreductase